MWTVASGFRREAGSIYSAKIRWASSMASRTKSWSDIAQLRIAKNGPNSRVSWGRLEVAALVCITTIQKYINRPPQYVHLCTQRSANPG
jgi:hypothetical protein